MLSLAWLFAVSVSAQDKVFQLDPKQTSVHFALDSVLHTVHGTFELKRGSLIVDVASGRMSGEIVVDARSGNSDNGLRDRKMHREILESDKYPEFAFQPSRMEGTLAPIGKSPVQVHGTLSIHGSAHEVTLPAEVDLAPDRWSATIHFTVPYVKWGLKNPSNLFLRVNESVQITVEASGSYDAQVK